MLSTSAGPVKSTTPRPTTPPPALRFSRSTAVTRVPSPRPQIPADKILEADDLRDVFPLLGPDVMLGLDLDETAMEMPRMLGRTVWFEWHIGMLSDRYKDDYPDDPDAKKKVFARALSETVVIYNIIHAHTTAQAVQEETARIIHEMHKLCDSVIAITSRDSQLDVHTPRQLACANITFKKGKHGEKSMQLSAGEFSKLHEGIMYCAGGNNKPACFAQFIRSLPDSERPKRLVYVDDNRRYVEKMREICAELGIEFVGVHYTRRLDKSVNFDPVVATKQLEVFDGGKGILISDDEARALLSAPAVVQDAKRARAALSW